MFNQQAQVVTEQLGAQISIHCAHPPILFIVPWSGHLCSCSCLPLGEKKKLYPHYPWGLNLCPWSNAPQKAGCTSQWAIGDFAIYLGHCVPYRLWEGICTFILEASKQYCSENLHIATLFSRHYPMCWVCCCCNKPVQSLENHVSLFLLHGQLLDIIRYYDKYSSAIMKAILFFELPIFMAVSFFFHQALLLLFFRPWTRLFGALAFQLGGMSLFF